MILKFAYRFAKLFSNRFFRIRNANKIRPGCIIIRQNTQHNTYSISLAASDVLATTIEQYPNQPSFVGIKYFYVIELWKTKYRPDTRFINDWGIGKNHPTNKSYMFPYHVPKHTLKNLVDIIKTQESDLINSETLLKAKCSPFRI
jgi:hypothetical protein